MGSTTRMMILMLLAIHVTWVPVSGKIEYYWKTQLFTDIMTGCGTYPHINKLNFVAVGNSDTDNSTYSLDRDIIREDAPEPLCVGGASQMFTSVLLAKLIEENENITWNTPVQSLIDFHLPHRYRFQQMTLKDILAHRTGLSGLDIVPLVRPYDREGLLRAIRYIPEAGNFRDSSVENKVLFVLVEEVIKALTDETWENVIWRELFQPLGMNSVTFNTDKQNSGLDLIKSAASVCVSGTDMARWLNFLLSGKSRNNRQIVSKESLDHIFAGVQYRSDKREKDDSDLTRDLNALGWIVGSFRSQKVKLSHDVGVAGSHALTAVIPQRNLAVHVAFTSNPRMHNTTNCRYYEVVQEVVIQRLLRKLMDDPNLNNKNTCYEVKQKMNEVVHYGRREVYQISFNDYEGARPLEEYVGTYRNFAFGDVEVAYNESGTTRFTMKYGQATYHLEPTNHNDTFLLVSKGDIVALTSGAAWYYYDRTNHYLKPLVARFRVDEYDPEAGMGQVEIANFDSHTDPVFSKNPQPPRFDDYIGAYALCSASSIMMSLWSTLMAIWLSVAAFR